MIIRVGRADDFKIGNPKFLADIIKEVRKEIKNFKITFVGGLSKTYEKELVKLGVFNNISTIKTVSNEKDLINIYLNAKISAHVCGLGESFGYSIAESMALQTPVIVNSTPFYYLPFKKQDNAQMELVKNLENGLVVRPYDSKAFAKALITLIKNDKLRINLGKNAREDANRFLASKNIRQIENFLEDIYQNKKVIEDYYPSNQDILSFFIL